MPSEQTNREPIKSEFASDPDMIELIQAFVSELPDKIRAIQDASDRGDLETLRVLAHQLKGSAGGYGYSCVTEASAVLEASIKAQSELAVMKQQVDDLVSLCRRVDAGVSA